MAFVVTLSEAVEAIRILECYSIVFLRLVTLGARLDL